MSKFFEDLKKDLLEAIECARGERRETKHPNEDLPAETYIIEE